MCKEENSCQLLIMSEDALKSKVQGMPLEAAIPKP